MLAWEAYETLSSHHALRCNMVTGQVWSPLSSPVFFLRYAVALQERQQQHGARHTACTVEMADVDLPVECAVVDEGQVPDL